MSTIIEMPKLSDTMTVGTVVTWYKKVGDKVLNGDILAEIETDKATMELENFDDGVLLQLLAAEGDEVEIGKPLAVVGEVGEELPNVSDISETSQSSDNISEPSPAENDSSDPASSISSDLKISATPSIDLGNSDVDSARVLASPLAKKIAMERGLDLSKIQGSGPRGRIIKKDLSADVLSHDDTPDSPVPDAPFPSSASVHSLKLKAKSIPVSKMRSVIATRLLESKATIPHFYLHKEIHSEPLRLARESINQRLVTLSPSSPKVSINDLILLSCAKAILQVPEINCSWADKEIIFHGEVNLAFGVAVEDGLVTPVIRKAEHLDLCSLSAEAKLLIEKSRNRKLTPDEMSGSTFTVTNLGMFGIDFFSGIINPPNAAILAVGASVIKPIVAKDGSVCAGETMTLGLSCDHRLVDGAIGARFLQVLAEILEYPASLLV